MRKIIVLLALIFSTSLFSQEYVLLEINSEWNWSNKAKIDKIRNIPHQIAYLENQTPTFRKKIRSVPLVILYKNGKPIMQWSADISFKLVVKKEEVLKAIAREEKKQ
jgi:hypothetical protein|tara:strand:- start:347 stop:667 length:321 start_codon:yes stop_codon:yes gene_type:complete